MAPPLGSDAFTLATIRPARQAPTAPHTAPHTGTRLLHASVAHFDMLYFICALPACRFLRPTGALPL